MEARALPNSAMLAVGPPEGEFAAKKRAPQARHDTLGLSRPEGEKLGVGFTPKTERAVHQTRASVRAFGRFFCLFVCQTSVCGLVF